MERLIATCGGLPIVVLAAGLLVTAVVAQEGGNQSGAAQNASAQGAKKHKETRWEGFVTRSAEPGGTAGLKRHAEWARPVELEGSEGWGKGR